MSLDEQLEPDNAGIVDRIDATLLSAHRKIAEFWQEKTYTSKDLLARYLHGASSCIFLLVQLPLIQF